jgi:hypothetical protein
MLRLVQSFFSSSLTFWLRFISPSFWDTRDIGPVAFVLFLGSVIFSNGIGQAFSGLLAEKSDLTGMTERDLELFQYGLGGVGVYEQAFLHRYLPVCWNRFDYRVQKSRT